MLKNYKGVFQGGLGTLKDVNVKLIVPDESTPKFFKVGNVQHALGPKGEAEVDRLEQSKVKYSEWAAPIVPVVKTDVNVRICGDLKVRVNPELQDVTHPFPKIEGIFTRLAGGQHFSKIDLAQAYLQMEVVEESKKYLKVNTHIGLYRYNSLSSGIKTAPAISGNE